MLRILSEPVQLIAPSLVGVLKYAPTQDRAPKGTSAGGQFASGTPTQARRGDIAAMTVAVQDYVKAHTYVKEPGVPLKDTYQASNIALGGTRAQIKQLINKNITARLKDHPAFKDMEPFPPLNEDPVARWVKQKIDLWAETSGDSNEEAKRMQDAVRKEFGLDQAAMEHMGDVFPMGTQDEARNRAFVRAEYEATQAWFKARGITHVSVFRGMGAEPGTDIGYENAEGDFGVGQFGLGYETVTMQPASSWSTDLDVAIEFGADSSSPVVLTARVPVETVLATCVTGRGCYVESELILLGKPTRARVFDTHLREEEPYDALTDSFTQANRRGKQKILASLR